MARKAVEAIADMAIGRIIALLAILLCAACAGRGEKPVLPRPQPGYLQWLQKQSMLAQVPELVGQVSQSERMWRNSGQARRADVLLNAAPNWLVFNVSHMDGRVPLFKHLLANLANINPDYFKGLYMEQVGEKSGLWLQNMASQPAADYAASLNFDQSAGSEADLSRLVQKAEDDGLQIGSSLIAAATGRGPDFLLQARHATGHGGLYAMLDAPKEIWSRLPPAKNEWDALPLDAGLTASLADGGYVPAALLRDQYNWLRPGGWAATGEIMGSDGLYRRWLYRYNDRAGLQPVMLWQDPSGLARQILSAAIIKGTGLEGQTLVGLHMRSIMGLEPADSANTPSGRAIFYPGIGAINELSAQVHRYGGWVLQADALPPEAIAQVLAGPCDFCLDAVTPLLLAYALKSGNAAPLAALYRQWLEGALPFARLAHGFVDDAGWDGALLNALPGGDAMLAGLSSGNNQSFMIGRELHECKLPLQSPYGGFILQWELGLPGLAFVSEDLRADLGLDKNIPLANGVENKNADAVRNLLRNRKKFNLANGVLVDVRNPAPHAIALVVRLPGGGYWIMAANFKAERDRIQVKLPGRVGEGEDVANAKALSAPVDPQAQTITLLLDGYKVRNVVFFGN